jgi:hypothetical protein
MFDDVVQRDAEAMQRTTADAANQGDVVVISAFGAGRKLVDMGYAGAVMLLSCERLVMLLSWNCGFGDPHDAVHQLRQQSGAAPSLQVHVQPAVKQLTCFLLAVGQLKRWALTDKDL